MEQENNHFLVTERVGKLMLKFAVPCVISLLVAALYNIVDQVFIGWGVGMLGNGATNVVFPLTVAALAVATMIGDGACSFVSISLGRRDQESAHRTVGNAVVLALGSGLVLAAVYLAARDPILRLFGATESNYAYAWDYFTWISLGIPFYMFGQTMNPIIRSDGSPQFAMISTLAGAVANVILDPIAIFVLGWGVKGAAIATVAGQIITAGLALWYLGRMKAVRLGRSSFPLRASLMGKFIPLGFCSFLSQISLVIAMATTNNMLRLYGGQSIYGEDIPLTVLGIVMKVFQIVISIVIGMAAGCIPVVGFNFGARRFERVRELMWKLLSAEAVLGVISFVLVEAFPRQLIGLFGSESELYEQFAVLTFRIYLCMIVLACVNKASFIFLQSLGKPIQSTFLSLFREVILAVPLVVLLPRAFGLMGVLYSMPVSDVAAFFASVWIVLQTDRQLKKAIAAEKAKT
ncbi:MAG: MATE family efflux transporter [Intestinimonas massiliensis]|uniref:MATE family efflux transporter n=1 Tax=Intestinimonas massiliensis (ex Afouda et al. 2020) TaxID=1673721 RepID=UPI002432C055|nr:MATE family efflux transporter [Intestinimonas massiliensis (ex Afouda et al. 2020)]MCI5562028.1 MATE family efflux transporter [Intestinimonas massiliensis (ex Afouda et al. 2020)]MDY3906194.1 MATE family efflux transporter [Lawsonibacter sp.]